MTTHAPVRSMVVSLSTDLLFVLDLFKVRTKSNKNQGDTCATAPGNKNKRKNK
ncbi:hypothetical protein BJX61DRAFT_528360 [Aspergillus egyptiacus]|nr:hypothetical protein BJX61DRAFT_528360 [Aspergillus egyptiacus]